MSVTTPRGPARGERRSRRVLFVMLIAGAAALLASAPASAHVVPASVIELDVHAADITASLILPADDLATATRLTMSADGIDAQMAQEIADYLTAHLGVTTTGGSPTDGSATGSGGQVWAVQISGVAVTRVEQWGTGEFPAVTATAMLTPPEGADLRSFTLHDDAILHQVVTANTVVIQRSDWAAGQIDSARTLGTISVDTVTGTIPALTVNLDQGSGWQGFVAMVSLGISHIADGTDHQLFLLTLLLAAPVLALGGRWRGAVTSRHAVRRITAITVAFTIGHSVTLALGTLGVPLPTQAVEAAIAVTILIAAAHALRPLFPGREGLVAGAFGLVHGMAFATTLAALNLSGSQLAWSLLGFNAGIEIMQLAVVLIVLPALLVLARTPSYRPLRIVAALITATAAVGWLLDRLGMATPLGSAADALGPASPWIAGVLWIAAAVVLIRGRRRAGVRCSALSRVPPPRPDAGCSGSSSSPTAARNARSTRQVASAASPTP